MKKPIKALLLTLAAALCSVLSACSDGSGTDSTGTSDGTSTVAWEAPAYTQAEASTEPADKPGLWRDADYAEDTELGEGAVTVKVKVIAEDKAVTFTVHTDRDVLGAALIDNRLVSGDESRYGLFIKFVNGMEADYDKNGAYWAISRDGEYLTTGADVTPIADGESYEFTYTKG